MKIRKKMKKKMANSQKKLIKMTTHPKSPILGPKMPHFGPKRAKNRPKKFRKKKL